MATTKKKAAVEPEETLGAAPELSRTAPFKPRNIAAYEAAVEQFALASSLFVKGHFAEAQPLFAAVAETAAADEPILSDRARTYASICGRKIAIPSPVGEDADANCSTAASYAAMLRGLNGAVRDISGAVPRASSGSTAAFFFVVAMVG